MTVIEADGQYLRPARTVVLRVEIGQRYSVLVHFDQAPGAYWIRARGADAGEGLGVLHYQGVIAHVPDAGSAPPLRAGIDPFALRPLRPVPVPERPDVEHHLRVALRPSSARDFWTINNRTFVLPDTPLLMQAYRGEREFNGTHVITNKLGDRVRVVLENESPLDHSFHLHGHYFAILGNGRGTYSPTTARLNFKDPLVRDTGEASAIRASDREERGTYIANRCKQKGV